MYVLCRQKFINKGYIQMFRKNFLFVFAIMNGVLLNATDKIEKAALLDVKNAKQMSAWHLDGNNTGREVELIDGTVKVILGATLGRKWAAYKLATGRLFNAKSVFITLKLKNLGQSAKIELMLFDRNKNIWIKTIELEGNDWIDLKLALNASTFKRKDKNAKDVVLLPKDIVQLQFSVFNKPMVVLQFKEMYVISK
jgi:hypothetical protein